MKIVLFFFVLLIFCNLGSCFFNETDLKVNKNSSELHRLALIRTDGVNEGILQTVEQISNNQQHIANNTCSEECKDYFGSDSSLNLEKLRSCINGCRYYLLDLILLQSNVSLGYAANSTVNNSAQSKCIKHCQQTYPNDVTTLSICNFGCRLADKQDFKTITGKATSSIDDSVSSKRFSQENNNATTTAPKQLNDGLVNEEKMFSIVIPMIRTSTSNEDQQNYFSNSKQTSALSRMMLMFRSMVEHIRQMVDFANRDSGLIIQKPDKVNDDSTNVQERRIPFDSRTGESVSVQHSMSVVLTNDKDGHNKMVVMRTPPKITIHRAWNPFGFDFERLRSSNENKNDLNNRLKQSEHEEEERIQSHNNNGGDIFDIFERHFSKIYSSKQEKPPSNQHREFHSGPLWNIDNYDDYHNRFFYRNNGRIDHNENKQASWSSCLFSMMPLLYLLVVILLLYVIIWLFYTVPSYVLRKTRKNQQQPKNRRHTILPVCSEEANKFIESMFQQSNKSKQYTKVSAPCGGEKSNLSPSNSTLSFPPSYADAAKDVECEVTRAQIPSSFMFQQVATLYQADKKQKQQP